MARAKRTERATARRRYRAAQAEDAQQEQAAPTSENGDTRDTRGDARGRKDDRSSLMPPIRMPDWRGDLQALPGVLRSTPLIWLPFGLLFAGAAVAAVVPLDTGNVSYYIVSFTLLQPSLLYFIVGFVAPRGSYLFGGALGLLDGILLGILVLASAAFFTSPKTPISDQLSSVGVQLALQVVSGALFAGFAHWYRDFLRRQNARSRANAEARRKQQRKQQSAKQQSARNAARSTR